MQVHRVLFEGRPRRRSAGRAAGRADICEFRAEREVILCGGAYNSPQLLMLSGVGSAELLTMMQIPVVADLPAVGQNLQDHSGSGLLWTHDEPVSLLSAMSEENMALFATEGRGPLTSNAVEAGGFLRTSAELPAPDLQFHAVPAMLLEEPILRARLHAGGLSAEARQPGNAHTALARSHCRALHSPQLLRRGLRHADHAGGSAHSQRDRRSTSACAVHRQALRRAGLGIRGRICAPTSAARPTRFSPGRHLPHGLRRRCGPRHRALRARRSGLRVVDASAMPSVFAATPTPRRSRSPSAPPI